MIGVGTGFKIETNLDGAFGYPTSIIKYIFGRIANEDARNYLLSNNVKYISEDEPGLVYDIRDLLSGNVCIKGE